MSKLFIATVCKAQDKDSLKELGSSFSIRSELVKKKDSTQKIIHIHQILHHIHPPPLCGRPGRVRLHPNQQRRGLQPRQHKDQLGLHHLRQLQRRGEVLGLQDQDQRVQVVLHQKA